MTNVRSLDNGYKFIICDGTIMWRSDIIHREPLFKWISVGGNGFGIPQSIDLIEFIDDASNTHNNAWFCSTQTEVLFGYIIHCIIIMIIMVHGGGGGDDDDDDDDDNDDKHFY